MVKLAIVKTGGKQFLVKENEEIVVDHLPNEKGEIALNVLAIFDDQGESLEVGNPLLEKKIKAQIVEQGKGEKIRISRFKAKVRYRKVRGFRPQLTKIKILSI